MGVDLTLADDYEAVHTEIVEIRREADGMVMRLGEALRRMRDGGLYKARYATFEDYCEKEHKISRVHAWRLAEAASFAALLPPEVPKPTKERNVRATTLLPPEQRVSAYVEAAERAGGVEPTTKQVEAVVAEMAPPKPRRVPPDIEAKVKAIENRKPAGDGVTDDTAALESGTVVPVLEPSDTVSAGCAADITQYIGPLDAEIADLRTRAEAAERERDELRALVGAFENEVLGVDPAVPDAERTEVRGAVWYEPTGDPWHDYLNIAMAIEPPNGPSTVKRLTQANLDRIRKHRDQLLALLATAEAKPAPPPRSPSPVTAILDQAFANDAKREPCMPVPTERGR